jgi:hypothetical protein
LRKGFSAKGKDNHSHMVLPNTPLDVDHVTDERKLPWHKYLKSQWSKNNQPLNPLTSLSPAAEYMNYGT